MIKNPSAYITFSLITLTLVNLVSCKDNNNGELYHGDFYVSGNIAGKTPVTLFFEELTPTEIIPLDTIQTDADGFFKFDWYIDNPGFYRLGTNQGNFVTLSVEPHQNIYLTAQQDNLPATYQVEGSDGSFILWKINQKHQAAIQHTDSLRIAYREARYTNTYIEARHELTQNFTDLKDEFRLFLINKIESNPQNLASILALYHFFEDELLLNKEEHFYYFNKLSKSLCKSYPSNKHVINLKKQVNDFKRQQENHIRNEENLAVGKPAPEILLPDPHGNPIALSSLQGNVVLIDFWAAWCPPCREANILLGELYEKYQQRGFEIYAISLDRNREQWINAIKKDSIHWTQVSDLRFMNSPVVSLYNVAEVPHYVLINREGKIISRNFPVSDLESLLIENL